MENLVIYEGGKALTTSRKVAEKFNKNHSHVMRDIREIVSQLPESHNQSKFGLVEYVDQKGEKRAEYIITKDGFSLLAFGFAGKKAMAFKIAFIEEFNRMEQALKSDTWMLQAITPNLDKSNQLQNTKSVASLIYNNEGVDAVKAYHRLSAKLHAGCSVSAIKKKHLEIENKERKVLGKKEIKSTPSAKEILRIRVPQIAAAMSLTDSFCKMGYKLEDVAKESVACIPIFKRMIESRLSDSQKNLLIV